MSLNEEMIADFLSMWEEVPISLCYEGAAVRVLLSHADRSRDLDLGGFAEKRAMGARAIRAELPPAMRPGSIVSVDGASYRVESIGIRPGLPIVTIELIEP